MNDSLSCTVHVVFICRYFREIMKLKILSFFIALSFSLPGYSYGIEGKCVEGNCQNGQGTWMFPNGSKFVGGWKDGKRHGQIIWVSAEGEKDVREYKNGVRQGKCLEGDCVNGIGLLIYLDQSIYAGEFKDEQRHGQGSWSQPRGSKYDGSWENDTGLVHEST